MTEGGEARLRGKDALSLSGGHLCHVCGHQYPNPNPSAKLRRSHRRNCRRPTPEPAAAAAGERNAGLVLGGDGGGPGDGDEPASNGAENGGSASPGSAEGGGGSSEDKENADEGNGTNLARPCTNGIQHKVPKTFTESAPLAVAHPVEREDSFEEYQDASSFLHQSDPEDGAALAHESDIPMEIKNLDKGSVGTSVAADVISVEMYGLCKDQFSSEPSMPDFPDGSKVQIEAECHLENINPGLVAREDGLVLQSTDECSADIGSNNTDVVVDSTENTCADCSMGRSSQSLSVQGTVVQLPVGNSCLVDSACSVPGYQNGLAVTNVNGMLKSIAEDNYNKGNLVKGSELDSSCEERPRQDVEVVTVAEGNTSSEKHNGFCTEEVCNRESYTEVPTMYQVSSSQEHVTLLMDQVSSIKNPFTLDDTRSEDLFELASGNYHFEAPNVVESKQQIDSTTLTGSNQTSVADRQHYPISDDRDHMLAVSNENGYAVGEDVSVISSADPTKNIFFHDASVNHNSQECESHTNGTSCVTSQSFSTEFGTMPVSQEINALSTYIGEKIETEYTDAKDMAAVESINNFEENKHTEAACAEELNSVLHTDNVEEEKLAEENGVKEAVAENNQSGATGSREARAVQSTESVHENDQTEDGSAKMATEFNTDNADNMQTGGTSKEEEMRGVQHEDNDEEKKQAEETSAKEMNAAQSTDSVEEQKETQRTVGLEGSKPDAEIAAIGSRMNSARISVPLKVLLAEASLENKEKKPSTKERVLSFRRRPSSKDDNSSAKPGSAGLDDHYWNSPAKLPHGRNVNKRSKVRKQPWMPFICCHSVH